MKPYFIVTKKMAVAVIAVTIILILLLSRIFWVESIKVEGLTNQQRVSYIKSLGFQVDDSRVSSKEVLIPQSFDEVYKEYNTLQKKAGFDLSRFKNRKVMIFTYPSSDNKKEIHLIIYKGEIIGGDVADKSVDGNMRPLISN